MRSKNSSSQVTLRPACPVERARWAVMAPRIRTTPAWRLDAARGGGLRVRAGARLALLRGPGTKDGLHELLGYVGRQRGVSVGKRALPQLDRLFVSRQIFLAVHAEPEVVLERGAAVPRELSRQVVGHEVGELAAGHHEGATSQK